MAIGGIKKLRVNTRGPNVTRAKGQSIRSKKKRQAETAEKKKKQRSAQVEERNRHDP